MTNPEGFDPKQAHVVSQWAHDRPLNACRFDPMGRYVFCGSEDSLVERFNLADGVRTNFSGGHLSWVQAIAHSKDGGQTMSAGCDGKITWWDSSAAESKPIRTIDAHKGWIRTLDVSPDGSLLASGGNDNVVRLWNVADGSLVREINGHTRHIYNLTFHPAGQFLFSGDLIGTLKQWEVATGTETRSFDAAPLHSYNDGQQVDFGGVRAIAVSPDAKWLVAGGLHKATNPLGAVHEPLVLLFDMQNQTEEGRKPVRQLITEGIPGGVVWRLKWLSDGSIMGLSGGSTGGLLLFWKPDTEKDFHRLMLPSLARDMDLHPDGLQVATAHYDRHLRVSRLAAKAT
jgi:WD40 repeat protein